MYKLVIFDMDGTILNTIQDLTNAVNHALAKFNYSKRTLEEVKSFVGNGIVNLMKRAIGEQLNQEDFDKVFKEFCVYYDEHCNDNTKPYNGIVELVQNLKTNNIYTAVVSNKAHFAVEKLVKLHFNNLFDLFQGATNDIKIKPSPDSVNAIIEKLNVDKKDCVYVGDSEVDIQTASNAQIDCISVSWGFKTKDFLKSNNASIIVNNVDELKKALIVD